MSPDALRRRLARRALHRSRSWAVSLTLVLCILVVAYAGVESALAALGRPALWISPTDAVAALAEPGTLALVAAAIAAVVGILLLVVALTPAHRSRHRLDDDRMVVIVENDVIAGALKRASLGVAHLPEQRVRASVSKRNALVRVTPSSGLPLDAVALEESAGATLHSLRPSPLVRAKVSISERGVVGS